MNNELQIAYPLVAGTILFGLFVAFIIYFVLLYRKAQEAMVAEQERMRQVLLRAEVEVREQTLVQVSRELHDNLGQLTSLISINLKMLNMQHQEQDKQRIADILALVAQLSQDIRHLTTSLNGDQINQYGWAALLRREVERVKRTGLVDVRFSMEDAAVANVPTDKALVLFRIVQELFNNTLKHSQASLTTLILEVQKSTLHLQYTDNGKGFDKLVAAGKGNGLGNIVERCQAIAAKLNLQSNIGEGVLVDIHLDI